MTIAEPGNNVRLKAQYGKVLGYSNTFNVLLLNGPGTNFGSLDGTVRDMDRNPLQGAEVTLVQGTTEYKKRQTQTATSGFTIFLPGAAALRPRMFIIIQSGITVSPCSKRL